MENELKESMDEYIRVFHDAKERAGSVDAAIAILQELGKDNRAIKLIAERNSQRGLDGDDDEPMTPKQKGYLKSLGVAITDGMTKRAASKLIDEVKGK